MLKLAYALHKLRVKHATPLRKGRRDAGDTAWAGDTPAIQVLLE